MVAKQSYCVLKMNVISIDGITTAQLYYHLQLSFVVVVCGNSSGGTNNIILCIVGAHMTVTEVASTQWQ